ncbi:MAG: SRPBCC domain-containing protein [Bellilinea sp.]
MSLESDSYRQTIHTSASPAEAFRFFRHETALRDWLCERASLNARINGEFYFLFPNGYTALGKLIAYAPDRRLEFSWLALPEGGQSKVEVTIAETDTGADVTIIHQSPDQTARQKWPDWLENFRSALEEGIDLRIARRPRLGIMIDEFNPEIAKRIGVPVQQGLRLGGTAEGSGAHAAGLLKDDVIVSLDGHPVSDFDSLGLPLQSLHAGDQPEIIFYRGPVRHTVPLTLSSFPIFKSPPPAEMARQYRKNAGEILAAWAAQLAGISEEQAAKQPAENEWSAREILAHFTLCERDYQGWVADMVNDTPVEDWLQMRPNVTTRIQSLVKRLNSLPALVQELAAAQEETADFLEHLPDTFVNQRKHLYRRVAQWALETVPSHYYDEHKEQIENALQSPQ